MADSHVVSGLKAKRADLAGHIDALQDQLMEALMAVEHIDASLRLFDPNVVLDDIKPKPRPPRHAAFKGQVTRRILTMLRDHGPLDTRTITARTMTERELNIHDATLFKLMANRIGAALRSLRERKIVASEEGAEGVLVWRISG